MKIVIVTGGIGSGKSTVCRILAEYGAAIYEADIRVKSLYVDDPTLLDSIEKELGESFRPEGVFRPGLLASRIFTDQEALQVVEDLVFPALIKDFQSFCLSNNGRADFIVFESATVLEKPQFDDFGDMVVLVDAPVKVREERACRRDGSSMEAVKARMANQPLMNELSMGSTHPRVDYVISTDDDITKLRSKVDGLVNELKLNK